MAFLLSKRHIRRGLDALAERDEDFARELPLVGYPDERRNEGGFAALTHIIVAQQISTKAARTINARLLDAVGGVLSAKACRALTDEGLRGVGLSRQKLAYIRGLSDAVLDGQLDINGLAGLDDDDVLARITALKGFGKWSAQMYLMFSLGRPDIWPDGDLGVQEGARRLKRLSDRPGPKEMEALAEPWRPHRGAAALFMWHYYSKSLEAAAD